MPNAEIRCIVLRGEGMVAFAAGADISEFEKRRSSEGNVREYDGLVDAAQHAIEDSGKPVIAVDSRLLHRRRAGDGARLRLALRGRPPASSRFPPPGWGWATACTAPAGWWPQSATRAAREIMYTGRRYSAR